MASTPLITFMAGRCDVEGRKVKPVPTKGYVYLYADDDLLHFCWRPRTAPPTDPEIDLIMFPQDGQFFPLVKEQGAENLNSPTTGRIFVLQFASSNQKHYFWMQSKTQAPNGSLSWFSHRDQRLGQIVDALLQGDDVDVEAEVEELKRGGSDTGPDGDADAMEVDEDGDLERQATGDAGQDATGGDPRDEGEASREGGADGGRAATASAGQDTNALIQNLLNSISGVGGGGSSSTQNVQQEKPFTTLPDLLPSATTTSYIATAAPAHIDQLCALLPPEIFLLAQESAASDSAAEPSAAATQAAIDALSLAQKRALVTRVLRSPQLQQSLGSLTVALRDGGLPMIGDALGLKVENGGKIKGGSVPLGGGAAVAAFVDGVKTTVQQQQQEEEGQGKKEADESGGGRR